MERKIGEVFTYKGKTYQVVESFGCKGCAFIRSGKCSTIRELLGSCDSSTRSNKTSVIFKEIKGMEIKNNQLTIDIPKGHIIDVEHSDLSKGIIKFRNDNITLEDIYKDDNTDYAANLIILSENKFFNKLLCIAKLIDIANYYNKGWKPDWNNKYELKYCISFTTITNSYNIASRAHTCLDAIYFKNIKDAQAVIDNPNFRNILDTIYKN